MHHALSGFALSLLGMAYLPMKHVLQLLSRAFCNASYKDYHRLQDPAEPMGYQQTTVRCTGRDSASLERDSAALSLRLSGENHDMYTVCNMYIM